MILSALFFLKIVLPIQGLLWFHTNFRIIYSVSVKNAMDILIRIEFVGCFGWYGHFNNIHEHGTSFHLFTLFSISFRNSFQSIGLLPPWLDLFLGILFFLMQL